MKITGFYLDCAPVKENFRSRVSENAQPKISWRVFSAKSGAKQASFRLTAGGFDTGWVDTDEQSFVLPENTLERGVKTEIGVIVRDNFGEECEKSSFFVFNGEKEWTAAWIGDKEGAQTPVYFRKKFFLPEKPKAARMYHTGLGYASVRVNGEYTDDARLDPAFTDYSKRVPYVFTPEIEKMLHAGENEILSVVAPGWRVLEGALPPGRVCPFNGSMVFSATIEWQDSRGVWHAVETDETWEACDGPLTEALIYGGTKYDAGIDEASNARGVKIMKAPGGKPEVMTVPPIRIMGVNRPVAVWPDGEDAAILDFGKNLAGVLRVPIKKGEKGDKIVLTHTEELTEDGKLFKDTLRGARAQDEYVFSGDERDVSVFEPVFTFHGFRYARAEGIKNIESLFDIEAVELRTDADKKLFFTCGNPLLTRIHEISRATEYANQQSILTDCPQRDERMGWLNDATVRFDATSYQSDMGAFFKKVVRDICDVQEEDGTIGCTAPFMWGNRPADPVCTSFLLAGLQAYMHNGNIAIVKEAYPAWVKWEEYLLSRSENYIVDYSYYGDWAGPVGSCVPEPSGVPGARSAVTPGLYMSTCFSYFNLKLLEKFAAALGLEEDAKKHAETAVKVRNAILDKFYNAETGVFAEGSQGAQAFALLLEIAPEPEKTALRMHEAVVKTGYRITTGNLTTRYLVEMLSVHGYLEDAWKLMTSREYPSLGYMIDQEATTVWERFELMKNAAMNSHCHPMYGAVAYWLYAYLIGIRPVEPAWKTCLIQPYMPENLSSAQATVDTPYGEVSVRWTKRYGARHLQAQIPFGMKAKIVFCGKEFDADSGFFTVSIPE